MAATTSSSPDALMAKMTRVEDLLKKHIELTSANQARPPYSRVYQSSVTQSSDITYSELENTYCQPASYGHLSKDSNGYVRYIPYDNSTGASLLNDLHQSASSNTASLYVENSGFPFTPDSSISRQQLLDLLPPTSYCSQLKDVFFSVFSPLFHVLHDPSFDQHYQHFYQDPQNVPLSYLALVFVVLGIAVTALDENHQLLQDLGRAASPSENIRLIAARYRSAAMRCLSADHFMWRHNLHTMQTLVLLIYALSHAYGPAWSLLGTAQNIAVAIGCHVDPSHLNVNQVEAEERRRCWAALMMLYTIQSTCLGNIVPIIHTAKVRLPLDLDDELVTDTLSLEQVEDASSPQRPSKMSYILFKFRLYQLAADICQTSLPSNRHNWLVVSRLDARIAVEEQSQKTRFSNLSGLPLYHQAHYYILNSFTNHLYLILHRPFLNSSKSGQQSTEQQHNLRKCLKAASLILDNYETLLATESLRPYRWYTYGLGSFHAFFAVSTLATIIGHRSMLVRIDMSAAITMFQSGIRWLRKVSSRSETAKKASDVLDRMLLSHSNAEGSTDHAEQLDGTTVQHYVENGNSSTSISSGSQGAAGYAPLHSNGMSVDSTSTELDLDGWVPNPELSNFLSTVPSQQWLAPSAFPWGRW
ncbi:hypothetical protein H2198_009940 [Neophaeococcomyces mojaviensis]|uniref:Uncharacterized protein n=1 Tax=Neophaeococcomyces mojaviensis TaxID=3383035 RepID=A0ACC2ZT70_9EURO|nr:hypothetical protein H2198_009940 [Knufia sp. JES_112]